MSIYTLGNCEQCTRDLKRCGKLLRALRSGRITREEYGFNFATTIVTVCDSCMRVYVASLPLSVVSDLLGYLQQFLVSVDFMPDPAIFIAGQASTEEVERVKCELRPRYIQVYRTLEGRILRESAPEIEIGRN